MEQPVESMHNKQTVVDNRGKAVNVMIPDASETMAGYVDVDYVDDSL